MSIVGIFTQKRPAFDVGGDGIVFDATIRESSELTTDVTEFPLETGAIGHDHAVQRPLRITMRVGISDNPARALKAFASGQDSTRSQSALEAIREIQKRHRIIDVVGAKTMYSNCMISSTRQETNKENEQGLELVVELTQLLLINTSPQNPPTPASNDPAETQAQELRDFGNLGLQ